MKRLKATFFLPALVLIALLGFGATGALAYAGPGGSGGGNLGATQDVTGPDISKVKVKQITQTSATVTWQTDGQDSDSLVEYGTAQAAESLEFMMFASADETMGINHALALVDLSSNTEYFFQVTSVDGDGNPSSDETIYSFTTKGEDLPGLVEDGTVTRDEESGSVRGALVGIWNVGDGSVGTQGVDAVTGSGVTLIQQGSGNIIPLTLPGGDGVAGLDATDAASGSVTVKWPGRENRYGTLHEIEHGARVVVKVEYVDGEPVVREVVVKPDKVKPENLPTRGVVRTVENGQVTIVTASGKTRTFDLKDNPGKSGDPHPGDLVTVFHGGSGKAKGLVRAAEVGNRLEGFLADIEGEHDADDDEGVVGNETAAERSGRRVHNAAKLENLLVRLEAKHREKLDRALEHSQGQANVHIEAAAARLEARLERRQANYDRLTAKLEARGEAAHRGDGDVVRPSRGQAQGEDGDTLPGGDRPARGQAQSDGDDTPPGGDRRGPATPHADGNGGEEDPPGDGGSS